MSEFTLDTSGHVPAVDGGVYYFTELEPLEQGYIAEVLKTAQAAFCQIDPETLATIKKDCAVFARTPGTLTWARDAESQRRVGESFWLSRNSTSHPLDPTRHGEFTTQILMAIAQRFGAQTVTLNATGKVVFA